MNSSRLPAVSAAVIVAAFAALPTRSFAQEASSSAPVSASSQVAHAASKARLRLEITEPKLAVCTGERIVISAIVDNRSNEFSGDVKIAVRVPASVKFIDSEPAKAETRGEWRILPIGAVKAHRAAWESFTLEAPATETKFVIELVVEGGEGDLDPGAARRSSEVMVVDRVASKATAVVESNALAESP